MTFSGHDDSTINIVLVLLLLLLLLLLPPRDLAMPLGKDIVPLGRTSADHLILIQTYTYKYISHIDQLQKKCHLEYTNDKTQ